MKHLPEIRYGLSLVEVVVVLSLLFVLVGLTLQGVQSARAAAAKVSCQNHLRQLALASLQFEANKKTLPPDVHHERTEPDKKRLVLSWYALLCPYVEQEALYRSAVKGRMVADADDLWTHAGLATVVKVFTCAADSRLAAPITDQWGVTAAYVSYVGNLGDKQRIINWPQDPNFSYGTIIDIAPQMPSQGVKLVSITDGTSNTLLFGERPPIGKLLGGSWYAPYFAGSVKGVPIRWHGYPALFARESSTTCLGPMQFGPGRLDNECDTFHYWSLHSGGANFALADGSVRYLSYSQVNIVPALATRASGETVNWD